MKKTILSLVAGLFMLTCFSQNKDHNVENDSISLTTAKTDSIMEEKAKKRQEMMAKIEATVTFPVLEAGTFSGVIPVEDVTEIPDPNLEYKLLFELVNFDSDTPSKLDASIVEVARIINLHVASGIPLENISPVIVVHAGSLNAFTTNEFYNGKFKMDNLKLDCLNVYSKGNFSCIDRIHIG